jgi:hypothetical protein
VLFDSLRVREQRQKHHHETPAQVM